MKIAILVLLLISCLLVVGVNSKTGSGGTLIQITDDNWSQILDGEWMVEFFAPWCPACRNLQSTWEEFASWSQDLGIRVGQVDITNSPGLSGRFMITALPTIYHVTSGTFRQYKSPRTKEDFLSFVEEKKWEAVEPISAWQSPASLPMSFLSQFYRVSMALRNVMNTLTEEYGIPVWSAYLIFVGITILVGLLLGLILVFIIDCIYPQKKHIPSTTSTAAQSTAAAAADAGGKETQQQKETPDDEIIDDEDDVVYEDDDEEEEEEENSNQEEEPIVPTAKKVENSPGGDGARKRRPRKD